MQDHGTDPDPEFPDACDVGWGEAPETAGGPGSDDWYRRERPPHHDGPQHEG